VTSRRKKCCEVAFVPCVFRAKVDKASARFHVTVFFVHCLGADKSFSDYGQVLLVAPFTLVEKSFGSIGSSRQGHMNEEENRGAAGDVR